MNMMQMLAQLKGNPMSMLGRFNIPQNIMNDPQAVVQHMMNNGMVSQDQYNNAVQMARNMGIRV